MRLAGESIVRSPRKKPALCSAGFRKWEAWDFLRESATSQKRERLYRSTRVIDFSVAHCSAIVLRNRRAR